MFGYVRVFPPQLKVWEYELYKSIYCGLCKHGGKRTTRLTRFFLSYDFVALATVRMALTEEIPNCEKHFCPYFPKKKMMVTNSPSIEFTSDAFIILAYYKLLDDRKDTKGIKRIVTELAPDILKKQANKAMLRCDGLEKIISSEIERLDIEEKNNCASLDEVADCFAVLLGEILSFGLTDSKKRIAYEIGYHIGRYIYIIDALDDFEKDKQKQNYNPLIQLYGDIESLKENINEITSTMKSSLCCVKKAIELLESGTLSGIIYNIITHGAENTIEKTLSSLGI